MYLQIGRFVVHCTELELVAYAAIHELEPNEETARGLAAREFQPRVVALLTLESEGQRAGVGRMGQGLAAGLLTDRGPEKDPA
jgi:hypothetical protein